jgi:hypothetical protein
MLVSLLVAAFVIRLGAYALFGGIIQPDEVFQYLEQAHRLVFGIGLIPWEYQLGVRSWLFPGFLAGVLEAARVFGDGPVAQNAAVAVVLSLLSLLPVACGFLWGLRAAGPAGALLAGGLNAVWSDPVLFAAHPLLDGVSGNLMVAGVFMAERAERTHLERDFLLAGLVLGLTVALRIQLLPSVAFAAALSCRSAMRTGWLPLLAGMTAMAVMQGGLDTLTLGRPFQSIWYYVWVNQMAGGSTYFGVARWHVYLSGLLENWNDAALPLTICVVAGASRLWRLLAIAGSVIAVFSCIPHKEMRFIVPAIPLLLTVAGTGSAVLGRDLLRWLRLPLADWHMAMIGLAGWAGLSLLASLHGSLRWFWLEGRGIVAAMHRASADPHACALAFVPDRHWALSGGYSHLRPGIRLVRFVPAAGATTVPGFDYALADSREPLDRYGMTREQCWDNAKPDRVGDMPRVCLWHNPAGCGQVVAPALEPLIPPFVLSLEARHPFGLKLQ